MTKRLNNATRRSFLAASTAALAAPAAVGDGVAVGVDEQQPARRAADQVGERDGRLAEQPVRHQPRVVRLAPEHCLQQGRRG